jgi:glycosyltransferase involved in cell wall biosynthesis
VLKALRIRFVGMRRNKDRGDLTQASPVVLYVSHTGEWGGGAEIVLQQLASAARCSGYQSYLAGPAGDLMVRIGTLFDGAECIPIPWFRRTFNPIALLFMLLGWTRAVVALVRVARRSDAAIIHANSGVAALAVCLPATLLRVPLIWHQWDVVPLRRVNRFVLGACARRCTILLATSTTVAESLVDIGAPRDRVLTFYPRIRRDFGRAVPSKAVCRRELGLPPDGTIIGIVGRLVSRKGHQIFLDAAAGLVRDGMELHAVILGDAPHVPGAAGDGDAFVARLRARAAAPPLNGRVTFLPHRDDVETVLAACDVLVVPSANEPFGIVILEAFAVGTPVVASSSGGPREIIEHERTGLLVLPGDAAGFVAAIRRITEDHVLRDNLVAEGMLRLRADFSEDSLVRELGTIYDGLIGHRSAGRRV